MNSTCSECKNILICKYVENYKKVNSKVIELMETLKKDNVDTSFFKLDIKCQFFVEKCYTRRPFDVHPFGDSDFTPAILPTDYDTTLTENPCVNCPYKPDLNKITYIGDSPCDWCDKNPYKTTFTSK